jgi:cytochrome c oxidase assembly protein Cox11
MAFDVNEFFQSVDIILTQRLADLSYDKTVIATIVDDSDKEKGHYVVSNGTIKFDAYSNDTSYKIDDQVRVTILNGDWSQKKFIVGKYSDKDTTSTAVNYVPPLGTVM